jgi:4,5:9,10-diseco-3-hydroxy-5,9,17-trioxoandrosta-1(10),2-diene-4-oate hydrolase
MIHGVGGWAENWREVMTPIARTGRRTIAFDLPGFGESDAPGDVEHFGPRDPFYPRFVGALLDELGIGSAHLVGNSMGGAVAFTAAVSQPERTRSLSLVAGGGVGTEVALFLRLCTLPGVPTLSRVFGRPEQARDVLRTCFYDSRRIPASLFEEAERYGFPSFGEFVHALRSGVTVFGVRQSLREHWVALASRFGGPVLVIWGRQDRVLPVEHVAEAENVMPQAHVELIDDCGHLPQVERTEAFLAALLPFLDRAEAAAAA